MELSQKEKEEIQKNRLLQTIPVDTIEDIANLETFTAGDIVAEGDLLPKGVGFVLSGELICENREGKKAASLNKFLPGSIFGVASLFGENLKMKYSTTIYAKKETKVLWLGENEISKLIESNPSFSLEYVKFLTEKIRFLNKNIGRYTSKNAEESLLEYLETICNEKNNFTCKLNIAGVARSLAVTRPSVYSSIEKLVERGLVEKNGDYIVLKEVKK